MWVQVNVLHALGSALVSLLHSAFSLQGIKHVLHEWKLIFIKCCIRIYLFIQKIQYVYLNDVQESEENSGKLFIPVESLCIYIFFYCFKTWVCTFKMGTKEQIRFKKNRFLSSHPFQLVTDLEDKELQTWFPNVPWSIWQIKLQNQAIVTAW